MRMTRLMPAVVVLVFVTGCLAGVSYGQATFENPPHWNADEKDNFFKHGELKELSEQRTPKGWDDVSAFESGEAVALNTPRGIVLLQCKSDGGDGSLSTTIDLPKNTEFVTILTRMRGPTIDPGDTQEAGAGMVYSMVTKDDQQRRFPRVEPIYKYGSLGGWKTYRSTIQVLPQERRINIRAEVVDALGELEVDRVLVIASKPGYQARPKELQDFMQAIQKDDHVKIGNMIAKTPELLEFRNGYMENGTPLIWASMFNAKDVADELIKAGADLEVFDESWQNTPLAWCCWWGNLEVAEVLVKAGAQTKDYAQMAASSKLTNQSPRGTKEDFDKIVKLIEDAQKSE